MPTRIDVVFVLAIASTGCAPEPAHSPGSRPSGETPVWTGVEVCGNGLDDSGDGAVDEDCPCLGEGARQGCWAGEPGKRGVGACRDGEQTCIPAGEFSTWGECIGAVSPVDEIMDNGIDENCDGSDNIAVCTANEFGETCGDGRDDDCDGLLDCADPDCAGAIAESGVSCNDGRDNDCDGSPDCEDADCLEFVSCMIDCPEGTTPTFRSEGGIGVGGSGILCDFSGPIMTRTCETDGVCPPGQVAIAFDLGGFELPEGIGPAAFTMCVPPPPPCSGGQFPIYRPVTVDWQCLSPCEECLIQYGGIYDNELHCAPPPPTCYDNLTPTFRQETETWVCEPMCDGGLYDPHVLNEVTVCVPC
jgi:hypothetical protein